MSKRNRNKIFAATEYHHLACLIAYKRINHLLMVIINLRNEQRLKEAKARLERRVMSPKFAILSLGAMLGSRRY